jgi:hypothetical protein
MIIPLHINNNNNKLIFDSSPAQSPMLIQSQAKGQTKRTCTHKQRQTLGNMYYLDNNNLIGATLTAMMQ